MGSKPYTRFLVCPGCRREVKCVPMTRQLRPHDQVDGRRCPWSMESVPVTARARPEVAAALRVVSAAVDEAAKLDDPHDRGTFLRSIVSYLQALDPVTLEITHGDAPVQVDDAQARDAARQEDAQRPGPLSRPHQD